MVNNWQSHPLHHLGMRLYVKSDLISLTTTCPNWALNAAQTLIQSQPQTRIQSVSIRIDRILSETGPK